MEVETPVLTSAKTHKNSIFTGGGYDGEKISHHDHYS